MYYDDKKWIKCAKKKNDHDIRKNYCHNKFRQCGKITNSEML